MCDVRTGSEELSAKPAVVCVDHARRAELHEVETANQVTAALRGWVRRYGDVPTCSDWDPELARAQGQEWRAVRYLEGAWPHLRTARHHFGLLSTAVRHAELEPRGRIGSPGSVASLQRERNRVLLSLIQAESPSDLGVAALQRSLHGVAAAHAQRESEDLHEELIGLASHALRWANHLYRDEQAEPMR